MKVHYINILLFALPLNILIYNQRNHKSTTPHTPKIPTTRLLCECELYSPANYDSDPQMKSVIDNFNKQTQQRFHEYDERMKTTRQKCKDKCDKEIQNIILKDKLEKQMAQQLTTLETKITTEDIPTCICEKSLADKTEKFCLNCSKNMGAIAPWWGLVCGVGYAGWSHYVPIAVAKAAMDAGMNVVIVQLGKWGIEQYCPDIFKSILKISHYSKVKDFASAIVAEHDKICNMVGTGGSSMCRTFNTKLGLFNATSNRPILLQPKDAIPKMINGLAGKAESTANYQVVEVTANYTSTTSSLTNTIIASIIAIVVIVLIMVIIYLILRYRRKKKMKKKLQYIKLLEE